MNVEHTPLLFADSSVNFTCSDQTFFLSRFLIECICISLYRSSCSCKL